MEYQLSRLVQFQENLFQNELYQHPQAYAVPKNKDIEDQEKIFTYMIQ